jgi:hypothetical protein
MDIPPEVWITMAYLAGGFVIALSACIFFPNLGTMIEWIKDMFLELAGDL